METTDLMPIDLTPVQRKSFREWIATRPAAIQKAFRKYPPGLYRNKGAAYDQKVRLYSILEDEDGAATTCTVLVYQVDNPGVTLAFERRVFGVPLANLEPVRVCRWWEDNPADSPGPS